MHAYIVGASVVVGLVGAVLIAPRVLALSAQSSAQHALARNDPRGAIRDASRALDYDGSSIEALTLRAAAFARLDAFALARDDLQRALRLEPQNWVTSAAIGDLLTRHGDLGAARSYYLRALHSTLANRASPPR